MSVQLNNSNGNDRQILDEHKLGFGLPNEIKSML